MKGTGARKADIVLLALILFVSALMFAGRRIASGGTGTSGEAAFLLISCDSREIFRGKLYPTAEECISHAEITDDALIRASEGRFIFDLSGTGHNELEIINENGQPAGIRCAAADCPDRICVERGIITRDTEPIVCLPHRLTVRLVRME